MSQSAEPREKNFGGGMPEKPLSGRRIVATRAGAQAYGLVEQIERAGGEVVQFPTIEIQPPESFAVFDAAIENIEQYDWLMFTSVNSVAPFLARLRLAGKTESSRRSLNIGAIGPETAKRLASAGITPSLVPERYQAEGILDAMIPDAVKGKRVLIPRAAGAREVLPETLRAWGATVDVVIAYRTVLPNVDVEPVAELLRQRKVDVITFTSSSTVKNFVRLFDGKNLAEIVAGSAVACIGPITARTVEQLGGRADIVADEFTIAGLTRAIIAYFQTRPGTANSFSGGRDI
ncbi:MAG TPA: uroporphyrinogen-III synthase [Candidatus Binatia bacterium]